MMPELTKELLMHDKIGEESKKFLDTVRKLFSGAEDDTIVDFMIEIVILLSIAERRTQRRARMIDRFLPEGHDGGVLLTPASGCAWARGRKGGRPNGLSKKAQYTAIIAERLYQEGELTIKEICEHLSISKMTLYNYLSHREVAIGVARN